MDNIHIRPKTQECYAKALTWITLEITSICCIFNPANIFSIILGSIICYFNNCFAYYKYLETVYLSEEEQKYIMLQSFLLPFYPFYICFSKKRKPDININFQKIYPFTITVVKQPQIDNDCPICLMPINNNDKIYQKCHTFHKSCINNWRKTNFDNANKCPICIQDLD